MIQLHDGYTILTKEICKWCVKVKELLPNAHYIVCDIPPAPSNVRDDFFAEIDTLSGGEKPRTFPMVFHNKIYIGGYNETKQRLDSINLIFDTNIF
jgi:glutaredoxin